MKKLLALLLMLTFAIVLVGCTDKDAAPTSITITGPVEVVAGKTIDLTATVSPEKAKQTVTWTSNNPDVAAVDATTGKVTGVKAGGVVITAKSTVDESITRQHGVTVKVEQTVDYPDLGGYTIKIAHSVPRESDPFSEVYDLPDKDARQQAWNEVETLYNVKFVVEVFDEKYAWGPPRWQYLIDQAAANTSDYDFVSVPDDKIGLLVEGNTLIDVSTWYAAYGNGFLDPTYQFSGTYKGKLYSIIDGEAGLNNVMYYNVNLVNELIESGHLTKTPAQIFNEGNWTYDTFVEYAIDAQAGLNAKFATELAADAKFDTYAVSGYSTYYWVGMTNAGGVGLVNPSNLTVHFQDPVAVQAAEALKAIADGKAMRPGRTVDGVITSGMFNAFTKGQGVFDTGDMWFIRHNLRWPANMWGEDTKYGYVPFPRPEGTTKESHKVAMGGTAVYVMPIGRDYSGFGEASAENVYRAFTHTMLLTEELRKSSADYNPAQARLDYANKLTDSEDSKAALLYIYDRMDEIAFFDPMSLPTNPVADTYSDAFGSSFHNYVTGATSGAATFAEAIGPHVSRLQENLTKAYS